MSFKKRKFCSEVKCPSLARNGFKKCVAHGGGKRCTETDCLASAVGKTDKCTKHGGGKRCTEKDCLASAVGKTGKCIAHGGGKRCIIKDCPASAVGKTDKCVAHGGGKRCSEKDCLASAREKSDKCKKHGGGKRCITKDCPASAREKSDKCKKHGGGKRCIIKDCLSSAEGKTDKCKKHGGGKRCPNCITWPDSRYGDAKYDGYCATCFKRLYPNDERSKVIYTHTKEIRVRNYINENFDGFVHDHPLWTGNCKCTHRRRVDHRKLIGNTILAIETDEFAHRSYDSKDEELRYDDLYMVHSGKWIFIRFNPDDNRISGKVDLEDKLQKLHEVMDEQIDRILAEENDELLEIIYLFC